MKQIKLSQLNANFGSNVRFASNYGDISELAENIHLKGILVPLMVEKQGSEYQIISGHRRFSALQMLLESGAIEHDYLVPVTINQFANEIERASAKLLGNDSQALTPDEWFAEIARLVESLQKESTKSEAIEQVSNALGKKAAYVTNAFETWQKMDQEAREVIQSGKVGVTLASVLAKKAMNGNLASLGVKFAVELQKEAKAKGITASQESLGDAIVETQKQVMQKAIAGEQVEEDAIGEIALNNLLTIQTNKGKAAQIKRQKVVFTDNSPIFASSDIYALICELRNAADASDKPEMSEMLTLIITQCDSDSFNADAIKNRIFKTQTVK